MDSPLVKKARINIIDALVGWMEDFNASPSGRLPYVESGVEIIRQLGPDHWLTLHDRLISKMGEQRGVQLEAGLVNLGLSRPETYNNPRFSFRSMVDGHSGSFSGAGTEGLADDILRSGMEGAGFPHSVMVNHPAVIARVLSRLIDRVTDEDVRNRMLRPDSQTPGHDRETFDLVKQNASSALTGWLYYNAARDYEGNLSDFLVHPPQDFAETVGRALWICFPAGEADDVRNQVWDIITDYPAFERAAATHEEGMLIEDPEPPRDADGSLAEHVTNLAAIRLSAARNSGGDVGSTSGGDLGPPPETPPPDAPGPLPPPDSDSD